MQEFPTQAVGKLVLIVEDDHWTRFLLHELLEAHDYQTLQAGDAGEAYRLAREHRPDLILLDIQLADASGLEVVERIQKDDALRDTPVVAVTAQALQGDEERIREGGCIDYIAKPFSSATLIETVRRYLADPPSTRGRRDVQKARAPRRQDAG